MMESLSLEEENVTKDIKSLFRLKKEINFTAIKDKRYLFRLEKETKAIKIEYLEILRIVLGIRKKKKIIINQ